MNRRAVLTDFIEIAGEEAGMVQAGIESAPLIFRAPFDRNAPQKSVPLIRTFSAGGIEVCVFSHFRIQIPGGLPGTYER